MVTFAEIDLVPGGIIAWVAVGLATGTLAGFLTKAGGYGVIGDLAMGLLGAVVGGSLFWLFVSGATGFWGSILVAFLAAFAFIVASRVVASGRNNL
jgi:uncharacterized membrane protein YeaQ/YmgE (transglycosylase-associated protein family)